MSINERVTQMINELEKGNKRAFSKKIGVSATVIENIVGKRGGNPSFEVLQKIIFAYAYVNLDWLLLGSGEMLNIENTKKYNESANEAKSLYLRQCNECKHKDQIIELQREQIESLSKLYKSTNELLSTLRTKK